MKFDGGVCAHVCVCIGGMGSVGLIAAASIQIGNNGNFLRNS